MFCYFCWLIYTQAFSIILRLCTVLFQLTLCEFCSSFVLWFSNILISVVEKKCACIFFKLLDHWWVMISDCYRLICNVSSSWHSFSKLISLFLFFEVLCSTCYSLQKMMKVNVRNIFKCQEKNVQHVSHKELVGLTKSGTEYIDVNRQYR